MNLSEPVLVLNCAWQAISVITVETALANTYRGAMTPIDTDTMIPLKWEHWATLPVRETDKFIRTDIGLKLIRTPKAPRPGVAIQSIEPLRPEWQPFLIIQPTGYIRHAPASPRDH
jgi:hypothetical protein